MSKYTIKAGDSLSKIAQQHGLDWKELAKLNQISNPALIQPGQTIMLAPESNESWYQPALQWFSSSQTEEKEKPKKEEKEKPKTSATKAGVKDIDWTNITKGVIPELLGKAALSLTGGKGLDEAVMPAETYEEKATPGLGTAATKAALRGIDPLLKYYTGIT